MKCWVKGHMLVCHSCCDSFQILYLKICIVSFPISASLLITVSLQTTPLGAPISCCLSDQTTSLGAPMSCCQSDQITPLGTPMSCCLSDHTPSLGAPMSCSLSHHTILGWATMICPLSDQGSFPGFLFTSILLRHSHFCYVLDDWFFEETSFRYYFLPESISKSCSYLIKLITKYWYLDQNIWLQNIWQHCIKIL